MRNAAAASRRTCSLKSKPLDGRVALVTGASRGIGQAGAVALARAGAHVILAARGKRGMEETDDQIKAIGGTATLVEIDLAEPEKIEALAQQVAGRYGKLDILVGNAGLLGDLSPMPHLAPDVWEQVMAVNLTANFHLIRCFDALLKRSDAGRAIFVTSGVTAEPCAYWGAYAVSKAALEMMAKVYAAENENTALKINLLDPGEVRTRMHAQAFPGLDPGDFTAPYDMAEIFVTLADPRLRKNGHVFQAQ